MLVLSIRCGMLLPVGWHAETSVNDCCDLCWVDPTCNGFTSHPASLLPTLARAIQ
ncbi:hypothetical protein PF005_g17421 [Phytophthora fragariae]|uniref:Apple domain-containing protein n=2 Tax=Phytophthora TaxID=4783 RepID=A0A6A3RJH0_9STRA|nr:hypothetical protein PF003_g31262 [Phytophthora fragariae]KAE9011565.1 hypothetical protein PR002_g15038 [Phytophthora rubi]KAE8931504.1 hypothetical protein PF009_g18434 [Phytophthora fragariae]KAE8993571.1 hypothetical protein PF011_g17085 [Phytophthora fragariae]KAE9016332.1 hypothetical protein PR001_g14684 [Phytophthora rubi]